MRILDLGGSPLSNLIEQIEAAARRQGFVLINGDELIDPARFFSGLNDNVPSEPTWRGIDPSPACDSRPGAGPADETDDAFECMAQLFGNMMGQAAGMLDADARDEAEVEEKRAAVAQLGRIIEGLTILVGIHADLVTDLVES
jgi:hypothetical protein